tara:strand:+ start:771 stop:1595 length:825 start_codon:yes stop_codon:yes gene_type:complete
MSKKNSREAKLLRREKLAKKRAKFNNPCPIPNDYGKYWGYIPNEHYFRNSAFAWNKTDCRFALRTKEQLVEYSNSEETDWLVGRNGKAINYVSVFHTGEDKDNLLKPKNIYTEQEDYDYSQQKYYYLLREINHFGAFVGQNRKTQKEWESKNPFYNSLNTFCLTKKDIKKLPSFRTNHSEITQLAKKDEAYNAFTEEELDNFLANTAEINLREHYVFEEGGLVIEEFKGEKGITLYQPKKKEETWKNMGVSIPFHITDKGIAVAQMETKNINKS